MGQLKVRKDLLIPVQLSSKAPGWKCGIPWVKGWQCVLLQAGSLPALENSIMLQSHVRLLLLVLEKHVRELEEEVKNTVLKLSPSAPSPLHCLACGNQSRPPPLLLELFGQAIRICTGQGKTASTTMRHPFFMPRPQI